ncbi:MAG: hypothetical protein HYV27_03450 [Candidatus Hydrogenedentes bacterium]|nr:hypothetical protein [Candidatus Hydrogenedentota bacterium]
MINSSGNNIARCEECGKLYEVLPGATLCSHCRHSRKTADETLHEAVERLARELQVHPGVSTEDDLLVPPPPPMCVRCTRHPQLQDSEFCLSCQIELVNDLGQAAYDLFEQVQRPPAPPYVSLRDTIGEKRRRTASSRVQLVVTPRLR